ncbi:MAG: thioredoxin domain-containing protein [Planctomycetaceae bacterium]
MSLVGCEVSAPLVEADAAPDAVVEQIAVASDGSVQHRQIRLSEALADPDRIVLVDFRADWCGPCRQLDPELQSIAVEFPDQVLVVTVDVDLHIGLAQYFQVSTIPDVRYFRSGKAVGGMLGFRDAAGIVSRLNLK